MNRRNFLKVVGGAGLMVPMAPAIVKAENIMRIAPSRFYGTSVMELVDDLQRERTHVIYNIAPNETPFLALNMHCDQKGRLHEWVEEPLNYG